MNETCDDCKIHLSLGDCLYSTHPGEGVIARGPGCPYRQLEAANEQVESLRRQRNESDLQLKAAHSKNKALQLEVDNADHLHMLNGEAIRSEDVLALRVQLAAANECICGVRKQLAQKGLRLIKSEDQLAACAAGKCRHTWQPYNTLPKDGKEIVAKIKRRWDRGYYNIVSSWSCIKKDWEPEIPQCRMDMLFCWRYAVNDPSKDEVEHFLTIMGVRDEV